MYLTVRNLDKRDIRVYLKYSTLPVVGEREVRITSYRAQLKGNSVSMEIFQDKSNEVIILRCFYFPVPF